MADRRVSPDEDRRLRAALFHALDDVPWPDMDDERKLRRYRAGVYRAIHAGVNAWLKAGDVDGGETIGIRPNDDGSKERDQG